MLDKGIAALDERVKEQEQELQAVKDFRMAAVAARVRADLAPRVLERVIEAKNSCEKSPTGKCCCEDLDAECLYCERQIWT